MILSFCLTANTLRAQSEILPYNPCESYSIPLACFDGSRSCEYYSEYPCSTDYCWASGATINNQGIPLSGLVENKTIEIGGVYTITQGATFKNCIFKMRPDARINISPAGSSSLSVNFDQCRFFGCNQMWQGIVVNTTNTSANFMLNFYACRIEDAYVGVTLDEEKGNYSFLKNNFQNNHIGVSNFRQNNLILNALFALNTFYQSAPLAGVNPTGPLGGVLMPDYPNAHAGIKYSNVITTIGVAGNANLFSCLENGIVVKDGGRIDVVKDIFQNIGQNGIWVEDILILNANGCTFRFEGDFCIRAKNASLNIFRNTFTGNWREGVHSTRNTGVQYIHIADKNVFNFTGGRWQYGIYIERPQATALFDSKIDDNTFTANAWPNQFLWVVRVIDMVDAPNKFVISNNVFDINAIPTGTVIPKIIAIWASFGDSDNFEIKDNDVGYNTLTQASGEGILGTYFGPGQSTSTGHLIKRNDITGFPGDFITMSSAIGIGQVANLELCENTVDWSDTGISFNGQNDIKLRENNFNHHYVGLWIIGSNGQIGLQIARGNNWDSPIDITNFAAINQSIDPFASEIIVSSTQEGNTLPWLPPSWSIFPDPMIPGQNWFHTDLNPPLDYCAPMNPIGLNELTPYEEALISGQSPLAGTPLWDLKHEVYYKLLLYPELRPAGSAEEAFFNSLNNTTISRLAQTQLLVHNAINLSSIDQQTLGNYILAAIEALPALESFDTLTDFSSMEGFTTSWFDQRLVLLQQFASNAVDEVVLRANRSQQLTNDLENALSYNQTIFTSQSYEEASKLRNELRVRHLLGQPITESIYQAALAMVQLGDEIVGKATMDLITFLAPCDQSQLAPEWELLERSNAQLQSPLIQKSDLVLVPNPSSGYFDVIFDAIETDEVTISVYDNHGMRVKTVTASPKAGKIALNMSEARSGSYWVILSDRFGNLLDKAMLVLAH